ncbi:MAG: CpaF family protein [Bdellovibrionota bacterium]
MWKITDINKNKFRLVNEQSILNIGNVNDCDIVLEYSKEKTIFIQLILDKNFIYYVHEKQTSVAVLKYEFSIFWQKFKIEKVESCENIFHSIPSYEEVQEIYSSQEFLKYLMSIQKNLSESKVFMQNNFTFSQQDVIENSCKVVDSTFWNTCNVFDKKNRDLYQKYIWMLWAQICSHGILTLPLLDIQISEIMVNESKKIYFEKNGVLFLSPLQFNNESDLYSIIERICSSVGRRIDESQPYCDARLKDGSRVHAIIPPLALNGPCLTIRKFPRHEITPEKLLEMGSVTPEMAHFLQKIVVSKKNILISGGTGSGKTTLLNCLSYFIPEHERIITIEDSAELKLQQTHVIRLESRAENIEKKGQVTMRDLLKNCLRMRPDRIIVGECRGGEALDMLQAMNTGHDGSMTTVHANSPLDALRRLETLVLFAEFDLPSRAVREQITSAVHYVVQQSRLVTGQRCVTEIHEIVGLCDSTGKFITKLLFSHGKRQGEIE